MSTLGLLAADCAATGANPEIVRATIRARQRRDMVIWRALGSASSVPRHTRVQRLEGLLASLAKREGR